MSPIIVWGIALVLIFIIIKSRFLIWNLYHSFIVWRALRKAKRELAAIGRHDIAKCLDWDRKWYGH
jgi:hypothetical protein